MAHKLVGGKVQVKLEFVSQWLLALTQHCSHILLVSAHTWKVSEEQKEGKEFASTEQTFSWSLDQLPATFVLVKLNDQNACSCDLVGPQGASTSTEKGWLHPRLLW